MASVLVSNRASGTPGSQLKCKFKRRRRRRSKRKVCSPPPVLKTVTHAGVWFHCTSRPPIPHRTEYYSSCVSRDYKLNTLSSFIGPFKYFSPGLENTEDEDNLSTSSVEVKENRNVGNLSLEDHTRASSDRQHFHCSDVSRSGASGLKRKRPLEEGNNGHMHPKVQLKCKKLSWSVTSKNALVQLNELKPGLQYKMVSQTGPVHAPIFAIAVEVNGLLFEGTGPTKKKAKMRAAEMALQSFVQFPNASQAHFAMGNCVNPTADFTSDQADFPNTLFKEFEPSTESDGLPCCSPAENELLYSGCRHGRLLCHTLDLMVQAKQNKHKMPFPAASRKNPVEMLNELRPGLRYVCLSETVEKHVKSFVMAVRVDGRTFEGSGRSKKLAKAQTAQAALQTLFNIQPVPSGKPCQMPGRNKCPHLPQEFADAVFQMVTEKFKELTDNLTSSHARHKVLAGIVMTRGLNMKEAQVVALSTGTKCINGEYISNQGLTLNDCHAEIVARRSLVRFLYSQLELHLSKQPDDWERSIFAHQKEGGYKLKESILFHLYISTPPCGDARLNSHREARAELHHSRPLNRKIRGHLRTKIESGEGTIPIRSCNPIQTWDGVLQGEQLLTMSCTDKINRWNILGAQGSLLSHFIEPIYLQSIVLGSTHHVGHLSRALCQRLDDVAQLPPPYRYNQPLLSGISSTGFRQQGKSPSFSVNWTVGDPDLEVINATTGKGDLGSSSRLCKRALYTQWAKLYGKLSTRASNLRGMPSMYCEAKLAAEHYQAAKQQLFKVLRKADLGTWVKKPPEQDQFLPATEGEQTQEMACNI
ncbi:double-stranded RNA-specific editase B2 [Heterodontus francisci]|uniref:double-stranded RNA-specific editase B2 n=1 Tax=Heterodontus francisci TaxID=7792 RepID=UPI00355C6737